MCACAPFHTRPPRFSSVLPLHAPRALPKAPTEPPRAPPARLTLSNVSLVRIPFHLAVGFHSRAGLSLSIILPWRMWFLILKRLFGFVFFPLCRFCLMASSVVARPRARGPGPGPAGGSTPVVGSLGPAVSDSSSSESESEPEAKSSPLDQYEIIKTIGSFKIRSLFTKYSM